MSRLSFLSHAVAEGVTGARRGQKEAEDTAYTRNTRAAEASDRRDRSRALSEYNQSIAETRRIEAQARMQQANQTAAKDELNAEKERLEIDKLRHPQKYVPPRAPHQNTVREDMMLSAQRYRDGLTSRGISVEEANKRMKLQYPQLGGMTLEEFIMSTLGTGGKPGAAPGTTGP